MAQGEMEEDLLQCIMCTNQIPEEFLRRHIKFHHMIQKEDAVKKVYQMHMSEPPVSATTQTSVTWIDTLENLEESIKNIENNAENHSDAIRESLDQEVQIVDDNSSLSDVELPDISYLEGKIEKDNGVQLGNLSSSYSDTARPSKPKKISSQMNTLLSNGTITITKVNEDDEPIIIAEKKTDKFISKAGFPNRQGTKSKESSQNIGGKECNAEEDSSIDSVLKISEPVDHLLENMKSCTRYKCPYCTFVDFKRYVVNDHVIIQHSKEVQERNKVSPMYGEARTQEMVVAILKDPSIIKHWEPNEEKDMLFMQDSFSEDDEHELGTEQINIQELENVIDKVEQSEKIDWEPTDATLPNGWLFREIGENGEQEKMYLSPCKHSFSSRDKIAEFLIDQGKKMIKTTGFKVADAQKSKCNGMCEGNCKLFVVPKTFYHSTDKNKKRQKTRLKFIADIELPKANKVKDKMVKGVPKLKLIKGLKYGAAAHKATRPWLVLIEEPDIPKLDTNVEIDTIEGKNTFDFVSQSEENKEKEKNCGISIKTFYQNSVLTKENINIAKSEVNAQEVNISPNKKKKLNDKVFTLSSESEDSLDERSTTKIKDIKLSLIRKEMEQIEKKKDHGKDNIINKDKKNYGKREFETNSNKYVINKRTERDKIKEKEMIAVCTLNENLWLDTKIKEATPTSSLGKSPDEKETPCLLKYDALQPIRSDIEDLSSTTDIDEFYNTFADTVAVKDQSDELNLSKRGREPTSTSRHQSPASKKLKGSDPKVIVIKENTLGLTEFDLMYNRNSPIKEMPKASVRSFQNDLSEDEEETLFNETFKRSQKNDSDSENDLNKKRNIEKLKRLQKKEIEVNKNEGTYVQCCDERCLKWRLVKEFEDPSMVPDYWICTMNTDSQNNVCGIGGHSFMSDSEAVDVKFTCGSMVWAKMKGYPWWPGMVDYCPDSEEYYWIEEAISLTEPAWYHVVFFEGKGNQVSRAWVKSDLIMKITIPIDPPKSIIKSKETKARLANAVQMATDAKMMSREERLEKYSFAALFNGKWGIYSDIESDTEESSAKKRNLLKRGIESSKKETMIKSPPGLSPSITPGNSKTTRVVLLNKKSVVNVRERQIQEKTKRTSISRIQQIPVRKIAANKPIVPIKVDNSPHKYESPTSQHLVTNKLVSYRVVDPEVCEGEEIDNTTKFKNRSPKKIEIEKQANSKSFLFSVDHCYSKLGSGSTSPKKSTILENLKYVNKALEDAQRKNVVPDVSVSYSNPNLIKHHPKPPLPSDVLIALSVRNLDPSNHFGASFNSIIAFLSLHFPYYNRNLEQCKEMVRKAYDINTREETGKENFRIKNTLIQQLSARINSYVERSRALVKQSMLIPELLDTFMDRFLNGNESNQASNFKPHFSCKMLNYLALISVSPPSSLEQLILFITFMFPSLQNDKTSFKKQDFENALQKDEHIVEYYLATTGQKMFILREGSYPTVLQKVRQFFGTKNNLMELRKSIYSQDLINMLLYSDRRIISNSGEHETICLQQK